MLFDVAIVVFSPLGFVFASSFVNSL